MRLSTRIVVGSLPVVLLGLAWACESGPSGPEGRAPGVGSMTATISGHLTTSRNVAAELGGTPTSLALAGDDDFVGAVALANAKITLFDGAGTEIFSTETGPDGEFSTSIPPGDYTLVIELDPATTFSFSFTVGEGDAFAFNAKVDTHSNGDPRINVELFRDADGDGDPDDDFSIQIRARGANDPDGGTVIVVDADDESSDDESSDEEGSAEESSDDESSDEESSDDESSDEESSEDDESSDEDTTPPPGV